MEQSSDVLKREVLSVATAHFKGFHLEDVVEGGEVVVFGFGFSGYKAQIFEQVLFV